METADEKVVEQAATFELRAVFHSTTIGDGDLYHLRTIHFCPTRKDGKVVMEQGWVRCPWCSRQIPKRIRQVFEEK